MAYNILILLPSLFTNYFKLYSNLYTQSFIDVKKKEENNENNKMDLQPSMIQHTTPSTVAHNIVHTQNHHQSSGSSLSGLTIPQTHQQLSWSCELCGRMFSTRDEWSVHAKSHLEVCYLFFPLLICNIYFKFIFFRAVLTSGKRYWTNDRRQPRNSWWCNRKNGNN